jgi:arylsulfatase A-like enzyme
MTTPGNDAGDIGNRTPGSHFGTFYWTGSGQKVTENLEGDDSRVIMDRVIPFIQKHGSENTPFFAVIWFHTPHLPVLTGEKYRNLYPGQEPDVQHFYGAISAMDEQVGRLNRALAEQGLSENTLIFFTSDNGPEGADRQGRTQGSTSGFRGRKRSLHEGGIRVPGIVVWPKVIAGGQKTGFPAVTSDYFPTIVDIMNNTIEDIMNKKNDFPGKPFDGISLVPVWEKKISERPLPIGFQFGKNKALTDNRFKLIQKDKDFELYDLLNDPFETTNISAQHPLVVDRMKKELGSFVRSCETDLEAQE